MLEYLTFAAITLRSISAGYFFVGICCGFVALSHSGKREYDESGLRERTNIGVGKQARIEFWAYVSLGIAYLLQAFLLLLGHH